MKVLFDANVFLSYLLTPDENRTIPRIVRPVAFHRILREHHLL